MVAKPRTTSKVTVGVFCLALAVVFALGVTSGADAKKKHRRAIKAVGTQITLESVGPDGAEGVVSSTRAECVGDRTVRLYMKESEGTFTTWGLAASAQTRSNGSWSAALYPGHTLYTGEYHAVVEQERNGRLLCRDAVSNEKSF
jgi:hypothetical protein